jgi:hypothetical protein
MIDDITEEPTPGQVQPLVEVCLTAQTIPEPCHSLIGWCPRIPWCLDRCLLGDG